MSAEGGGSSGVGGGEGIERGWLEGKIPGEIEMTSLWCSVMGMNKLIQFLELR